MTIGEWKASKKNNPSVPTVFGDPAQRRSAAAAELHAYQELKSSIHRKLIDRLDLSSVAEISPEQLSGIIKTVVEGLISAEGIPLTRAERERLVVEIQHETFGLGPLEPLLQDPEISDILVNGPGRVYVEKQREAAQDRGHLQGRRPPDADHRPDRFQGGAPGGRVHAHGRRPAAGRLPRQRHHSPAGAGRAGALHPPLRHRPAEDGGPGRQPDR